MALPLQWCLYASGHVWTNEGRTPNGLNATRSRSQTWQLSAVEAIATFTPTVALRRYLGSSKNICHSLFARKERLLRKYSIATLGAAICITSVLIVEADTLVVPNETASLPAPGASLPFAVPGSRYQNIYNGSQFLREMPQGAIITEIAFRMDESERDSFSAMIPDLEIRMSTSSSIAPFIPENFISNVGQDEKVVFPRGPLNFAVTAAATGANPFSFRVPLEAPFLYDPRQGSLNVDLFAYGAAEGHRVRLDAVGAGIAALSGSTDAGSSASPVPAAIIQVRFTTVPEPPVMIMSIVASAILICNRARRLP